MEKLVRIASTDEWTYFDPAFGREQKYILTDKVMERHEDDAVPEKAVFFLVDERDVDNFVTRMAQAHPGVDIEVYGLEKVGMCPAGDFVMRTVDKNGILPQ